MININVEKADGNVSRETIYNIKDFPYGKYLYSDTCRKKGKKNITYYNIITSFDIETTTIKNTEKPYGFMYIWQFAMNDLVVMGRTWEEFVFFIEKIRQTYKLCKTLRIVCYVHNLPYEFQFIYNFLKIEELFAKEKRKPLYFYANGIEWRCSYALSNMSLSKFCENSELCTYYKKSGEIFDYDKIRTPKTVLTEQELEYCYCDVRGLNQCIQTLLKDDNLATIPLTNTGYVRRYFKKEMAKNPKNRDNFIKTRLTLEQYELCKRIFRGGNTHASRFYADMVINNVHNKDIQSSYPAVMMLDYFPTGKFSECSLNNSKRFHEYINKYCVIMTLNFYNIRLKDEQPIPYIDIAHCLKYNGIINDNGRVLYADFIRISLTEIDFKIIEETYTYDGFQVDKAFFTTRGKLPLEFKKSLMHWYQKKTELKDVDGMEYEYMKSKNRVNSSFGMMVSDIIHIDHIFKDCEWLDELGDREEKLNNFYDKHSGFLPYQWGIYVTAHARRRLQVGINLLKDDLLYTDTDSLKYLGDYEEEFNKINKQIIEECEKCEIPAYAIKNGKKYYLGIFDSEPDYVRFKTLGAKKYCFEKRQADGSLKFGITVAGMNKIKGAKSVGGIDNFLIGSTYNDVGRTTSYYNDIDKVYNITVDNDTFSTSSNIGIVEVPYTLGVTFEYWERIIENYETEIKI